jgi:hypothetical protein
MAETEFSRRLLNGLRWADRWVSAAGENCCAGRAQNRRPGRASHDDAATTNAWDTDDAADQTARAVRG